MRNFYKVLSCQYDPLGVILSFTTWARVLVQETVDEVGEDLG